MIDIKGIEVYSEKVNLSEGENTTPLHVNTLPGGMYYLQVMTGSGEGWMAKLIVR